MFNKAGLVYPLSSFVTIPPGKFHSDEQIVSIEFTASSQAGWDALWKLIFQPPDSKKIIKPTASSTEWAGRATKQAAHKGESISMSSNISDEGYHNQQCPPN